MDQESDMAEGDMGMSKLTAPSILLWKETEKESVEIGGIGEKGEIKKGAK